MASKKKERLIARAKQTARLPHPPRLREEAKRKGFRVVSFSLYTPEADWIEEVTRILREGGVRRANRSLVVQEAISRLREALSDKSAKELLEDIRSHQAARLGGETP